MTKQSAVTLDAHAEGLIYTVEAMSAAHPESICLRGAEMEAAVEALQCARRQGDAEALQAAIDRVNRAAVRDCCGPASDT